MALSYALRQKIVILLKVIVKTITSTAFLWENCIFIAGNELPCEDMSAKKTVESFLIATDFFVTDLIAFHCSTH